MSKKRGEEHFGSDAFLDVLANMVGILIILIVVSGIRASRMPPPSSLQSEVSTPAPVVSPPVETPAEPEPAPIAVVPPPLPEIEEQTAEEIARAKELEAELAKLADEARARKAALQKLLADEEAARRQLGVRKRALAEDTAELSDNKRRLVGLDLAVGEQRQKLSGLIAEFEEVKDAKAPVVQVKHKLTPISQAIAGEELHFRLAANKVAVVPLEQLIDRLKTQIERQKDMLARFRQHQGTVGPVNGFSLNYVVERQSVSVMEELRHGSGMFRISVSMWQLAPEPDLESETAEQALKSGSQFTSALLRAPPKSSLTFWVYPDSFALFRQLQAAAQAEGFVVSARPLPFGIPIAGSPHGTRSAGQ